MDFSVPVLRLADATVGEGVAGVVGVHAKVEVMTGVSHGQLGGGVKVQPVSKKVRENGPSIRKCIVN